MSKVYKSHIGNKKNIRYKQLNLEVNLKGFLCSCNNREKECILESYNILHKYVELLGAPTKENTDTVKCNDDKDISDELSSELSALKGNGRDQTLFKANNTGAKNIVFIRTTLENPVEIANKIVSDIMDRKSQQTRFLLRLLPIEVTCKAYLKDILNAFDSLCIKYFAEKAQNFSVVFNHRNNNSVSRDEVIKGIADKIAQTRTDHKVNLKEAEVSILVEVIGKFAFIGVVPDFIKYKKYNLLEVAKEDGICKQDCMNVETETVISSPEDDVIKANVT